MKFCDKLQKIRKENNITQEGLADKLNVSRQAVSKWESGTAYPDTEKLIQISKIFNTSLDELINDNKDSSKNISNKKFNFMETFNMIFDFISKSFNMFWSMTFGEKIKFIFEMGILVLGIFVVAIISKEAIITIIRKIFMFMPSNILMIITSIFDTIIYILWIILGCIIFIKVFKTRYLDYYIVISDDSVQERVKEEPIKELKEKKEYKIVIRDPKHSNFNLLKKVGRIFIFCLKIFGIFLAIPAIMTFIFLMILFVISLGYLLYGLFFNGISLALLGMIAFTLLVLWFIYNLIFNQRNNYQRMFMVFIVSISLIGIGFGVSIASLRNFEIVNDNLEMSEVQTVTISMKDNLIVPELMNVLDYKFVIDDEYENIKIEARCIDNFKVDTYAYYTYDEDINSYKVVNIYGNYDGIKSFNKVLNDFKNKKINTYILYGEEDNYVIDKVYISSDNLTKIKENYKKHYDK